MSGVTIRDLLRAALTRGTYDYRPLPGEDELQRKFGASRGSVRQALEMLREEGFVERVRGAGTFVAKRKTKQLDNGFHGLGGVGTSLVNVVTGRRIIHPQEVLPTLLEIPSGTEVLRLDRQTVNADGQCVAWFTSYLPMELAAPLAEPDVDLRGEFYESIERALGFRVERSDRVIEAVVADPVTASVMRVAPGSALLRHERVLRIAGNRILEFAIGRQRGDQVALLRHHTRE